MPLLGSSPNGSNVNTRHKHTLAFQIGAIITAAVLQHVGQVYGSFSREELRVYSLIAIPATTLAYNLPIPTGIGQIQALTTGASPMLPAPVATTNSPFAVVDATVRLGGVDEAELWSV
jgi:hypothetical protein